MKPESEAVFNALFALEDVREILRESAPNHELSEPQKERLAKLIEIVQANAKKLEALL